MANPHQYESMVNHKNKVDRKDGLVGKIAKTPSQGWKKAKNQQKLQEKSPPHISKLNRVAHDCVRLGTTVANLRVAHIVDDVPMTMYGLRRAHGILSDMLRQIEEVEGLVLQGDN